MQCTKCGAPANATGIVCDDCMIDGGGVIMNNEIAKPVEEIKPMAIPTNTDDNNDDFERYIKKITDTTSVHVTLNKTKQFSEISVYRGETLAETQTFTDKAKFEEMLSKVIAHLENEEKERLRAIEEKEKYFTEIKGLVDDMGFESAEPLTDPPEVE